ncbi:hypothetical protein OEZ49_08950 [Ruegeria sp. WL0004]|uniref:Hdr-like menaquinol oxidoreductase cytochrome c subunit n=1 Tax=Ruegeria marisflavi TaxID=2984152 RepID=A0ABT2WQI4_9RHOB|nr:hypothetical protein [Ruegeria sp. WL0004]MCU9837893.1 hypothetical protein [Ruegeria sp. WL0004]
MRASLLIAGLIAMLASAVWAEGHGGLGPVIPEATGKAHPEGNDYMRRWHMSMMRHDRDVTMYEGKREQNASLGGCFECHAAKDETGAPVTYADERHFCRSCHDFVAVRVDCFDCHRSTPEGFEEPPAHAALGGFSPSLGADVGALVAYLGAREEGQ